MLTIVAAASDGTNEPAPELGPEAGPPEVPCPAGPFAARGLPDELGVLVVGAGPPGPGARNDGEGAGVGEPRSEVGPGAPAVGEGAGAPVGVCASTTGSSTRSIITANPLVDTMLQLSL
jgi:hypothetical protein